MKKILALALALAMILTVGTSAMASFLAGVDVEAKRQQAQDWVMELPNPIVGEWFVDGSNTKARFDEKGVITVLTGYDEEDAAHYFLAEGKFILLDGDPEDPNWEIAEIKMFSHSAFELMTLKRFQEFNASGSVLFARDGNDMPPKDQPPMQIDDADIFGEWLAQEEGVYRVTMTFAPGGDVVIARNGDGKADSMRYLTDKQMLMLYDLETLDVHLYLREMDGGEMSLIELGGEDGLEQGIVFAFERTGELEDAAQPVDGQD